MTRVIEFLISLAIVAALFLVVGLLLPSSRHLVEKTETNRKLTIVFDTLNSLRRFDDWNPLVLHDPRAQLKLSGPESGVGARLDYVSQEKGVGEGSWTITESVPKRRVAFAVTNSDRGNNKRYAFEFEPTGRNNRNVEITQTYDVDYGWNILGRYFGLYVSRYIGDDMKLGLARLTNVLATVPNVDYAQSGSKLANLGVVELPAEDILFVNSGAIERGNDPIQGSMNANMEWIKRTMAANGLQPVGPMRIITNELGRTTYNFDIAQAVRKGGPAPAADAKKEGEAGADGGEAAAAPAAEITTDAGTQPELKLNLQGPVKYVRSKPGRFAHATYSGFMAELETVRNAVRAWSLTQGYEVTDRPFEFYKSGVKDSFSENGQFEVYWRLK
jgi:predicted transcriptional regulator YdeE